ncbi:MAG TPA: TIGR03435 family protein [Candidatus Acidoferrales bacterium]|nr:TIGR03435 family protein [Candidatus Acidoferrales bacterium]
MIKSVLWGLSNSPLQTLFGCRFNAALFPAVVALFFACMPVAAFGQTASASPATQPSHSVVQATPASAQQPKFEVADVHSSATSPNFVQTFGGVLRDGTYIYRDATMLKLIEEAYGVQEDVIGGGPGWVGYDLFDVVAKVPADTTQANAKLMLRSLLADRFGLVIQQGTSPVPRYVLTIGKGGSKLQPSDGSETAGCKPIQQQQPPPNPAGGPPDLAAIPNAKVACHSLTGAEIAQNLHDMAGAYLDHDVVDETKLDGTWDFNLEWTARALLPAKGDNGISLFDAVNKQLGLDLKVQDVPEPSLVIESVNRKPTANASDIATKLVLSPARFEVADIKPADPNARPFQGILYTGGLQVHAGGTLRQMIAMALQTPMNVAEDTVIGLPKSADTQRWDIIAKLPSTGEGAAIKINGRQLPPPLSVALEMMRGMLVDQFEMKTHTENREVTVYALTVENNKPKLTQAADSERMGCKPDVNASKVSTNIEVRMSCKNTSMAEFAQDVQGWAGAYIDHPVVDATGLQGGWDFVIAWTPKALLQPAPTAAPTPSAGGTAEASTPNGGISVFDAIASELGLKLVKQQRSIPVIVVDHVDEKPVD